MRGSEALSGIPGRPVDPPEESAKNGLPESERDKAKLPDQIARDRVAKEAQEAELDAALVGLPDEDDIPFGTAQPAGDEELPFP